MTSYSFTTEFTLDCPQEAVWNVLLEFDAWPKWWKGIHDLTVRTNGPHPKIFVKLGYRFYALSLIMTNESIDRPKRIAFRCSGNLTGTGVFRLKPENGMTRLEFDWDVKTTQAWMNLISPLARPFFVYSHNHVMKWFAEGLAHRLNTSVTHEIYRVNS